MRPAAPLLLAAAALVAYACSQQAPAAPTPAADRAAASAGPSADGSIQSQGATPWEATIKFGHDGVGSGYPPPAGHDQSGHAVDTLIPTAVVIRQGGTVYFETFGVHQLAIYNPGKRPEDVNTGILTAAPGGCPPVPLINDPVNRLAFISRPCGPPVTLQYTFANKGKHLVICAFLFHFVDFKMYGWVNVM